jgi:hypothetical protein
MKRLPEQLLQAVESELRDRGPLTPGQMTNHGTAEPYDWYGWKFTGKVTTLALEVLSLRCRVVVVGRTSNGKLYDVPERAVPSKYLVVPDQPFDRWAIMERVHAAGMLADAAGPQWSMLKSYRHSGVLDRLVGDGQLTKVRVDGSRREYYVAPSFFQRSEESVDDALRILGPLDPMIWDRKLVQHAFGFEYVWEVYKPREKRRYGWYVCPMLHQGRFVGRIEARLHREKESVVLRVDNCWASRRGSVDEMALKKCLERHACALGATDVEGPGLIVTE